MATVRARRGWAWFWLVLGFLYFSIPLVATLLFSLHGRRGSLSLDAYRRVFSDPQFLETFWFSLRMSLLTILAGLALILPTVMWIHLRAPKAKPAIETLCLMPFVIPPVVLVFGLIRLFSTPPFQWVSSPALLVAGYVVLSFPYIYRSVDAGLTAIDLRHLVEAAQSLGAGWGTILFRVVVPNTRGPLLSAAFLTFSLVIGEFTLSVLLAWPAFGPYMALLGRDRAYEPAALAVLSFTLTWGLTGAVQFASHHLIGKDQTMGGTH